MKNLSKLSLLGMALFLLSSSLWASSALKQSFTESFSSHYIENKCGENILNLIGRAHRAGLEINTANILEIANKGFSVFGMVNAEYARESGPWGTAGETNWYHHVVLEKDGLIYDFDFGNTPQVTTVKQYFDKMFLIEKTKDEGGDFFVGREEKLKTYEITIRPGLKTWLARQNKQPSPLTKVIKLEGYLKSN